LDRVDVMTIDGLSALIVNQAEPTARRRPIGEDKALQEWRDLLHELGEGRYDADFLHAEWNEVILEQQVPSRTDYFRASRAGRGRSLSRIQRAEIWQLVEKYTMRLDEKNLRTFRQIAGRAAQLEENRALQYAQYLRDRDEQGPLLHREMQSGMWQRPRYHHVVVDEAQDLGSAHWRILRGVVPEGPGDLFLVGDPHQRIYGNYISLSKLGINIRGRRSAKLTLSYRTTYEILARSLALLGKESWDDMDEGSDNLSGYRSILHGPAPAFIACDTWDAERDRIAELVSDLIDGPSPSIGICVPDRYKATDVEARLAAAGIPATTLGPDGPKVDNVVHIGTMHRFKGLEYQHMIIAHVTAGSVPPQSVENLATTDPLRYKRELKQARSLLFVAATRARDSLTLTWHNPRSPFLPSRGPS
jgi:superfamily I DNA/RNA helicase